MRNVDTLFVVFFVVMFVLLTGCESRLEEVNRLKEEYSAEELNYFYEVAFHSEVDSKTYPIRKWNKNIQLFIEGDTLLGDMDRVLNAVNQLNELQLPVKLNITKDKGLANMHVSFGKRKALNLGDGTLGIVRTESNEYIHRVEVKIVTEPSETVANDYRTNHILEEITQGLGIAGDSFAYPLSIFYEKLKRATQLSNIDKKMLQLLYNPALPGGYRCEEFEKDFAEQLYHINREEKFLKYVKEQGISKRTLQQIFQYGLIRKKNNIERVIRFNYPIQVSVNGDTTKEQKVLIQKAIEVLNQVTEQIKLKFVPSDSLLHHGGIGFNFSKNNQQPHPIGIQISVASTETLIFDKRFRADIQINFKDTVTAAKNMPLAVANTMYQAISLLDQNSPDFFRYENETVELKPEYKEILKVYYSNSLAENLTKEELQRVIDQIE